MTGTGSSRIWTRASGRRGISVPRQEVERNSLHSGANRLKTRLFPAIDRGSTQERMHGRRRTETEPQGAAFSLESNEDPGGPLSRRDRKSVVEGKRVSVRVDLGGRRVIKTKKETNKAIKERRENKTKN